MNRVLIVPVFLMSQLAFADEKPISVINQPIIDIGAGAKIKGPLIVRDSRTGEVVFSVRSGVALDVADGSTGGQVFLNR